MPTLRITQQAFGHDHFQAILTWTEGGKCAPQTIVVPFTFALSDQEEADLVATYNRMGNTYRDAGDTDRALSHSRDAIHYWEGAGSHYGAGTTRHNVAVVSIRPDGWPMPAPMPRRPCAILPAMVMARRIGLR